MKAKIIALIIAVFSTGIVSGQEDTDYKKFPAQISFISPIGTSGKASNDYEYNFSLNVLSGSTGQVKGCEIGGLLNVNRSNMIGFQVAGIGNITKGNLTGTQISGVYNLTDSMTGVQVGGILNNSTEISGIQVSGIFNKAENVKGMQISGIFNRTKVLKGMQIGLINYSDTVEKGISIGLINIVKKGHYDEWTISASDYQNIGISYKSGRKEFYNIYSTGVNFYDELLWVGGLGFGHISELNSFLSFQPEIMVYTYLPKDFRHIRDTYTSHLKLGFTGNISEKLAFSLAPSVYWYIKSNRGIYDQYGYNYSPLPAFLKFNARNSNCQTGIGYGLSVGLIFK